MTRRRTRWTVAAAVLLPALAQAQLLIGSADLRILGALSTQLEIVDDSGTQLAANVPLSVPTHDVLTFQTKLIGDPTVFGGPVFVHGQLSGPGLSNTCDRIITASRAATRWRHRRKDQGDAARN